MPLKGIKVFEDVRVKERRVLEFVVLCLAAIGGDALLATAFDPLHQLYPPRGLHPQHKGEGRMPRQKFFLRAAVLRWRFHILGV